MKTVSQRDLNKLIKREGWELTPDSKKAIQEQNISSALSMQVEAITNLSRSMDSIKDALMADTGKDYTPVIDRLVGALKEIKTETTPTTGQKEYRFIVKRGPDGMITEVEAVTK